MNLHKTLFALDLNKLLFVLLFMAFTFMVLETAVSIIPWYRMYSIEIIQPKDKKAFAPGDMMPVIITRKALIPFEVHLVRELIKINVASDEMIWRVHEFYGVQPGLRKSTMYLRIPTLAMAPALTGNSYIWKGTMMYSPLGGPEKTVIFKTPKFHIKIPGQG